MRTLFQKLLGRGATRSFDAAGQGRRWDQPRTLDSLNTAILAGATPAARRAGWYARNNPWVAAAVDRLVGNVIGAGIKAIDFMLGGSNALRLLPMCFHGCFSNAKGRP